jgi:hypothetical protein
VGCDANGECKRSSIPNSSSLMSDHQGMLCDQFPLMKKGDRNAGICLFLILLRFILFFFV